MIPIITRTALQTTLPAPASGSFRVLRGGSWVRRRSLARVAVRGNAVRPDFRSNRVGFRLARTY
ncbi:MAG: SUMF1/EgtB/PvdO family nonheme iron enzyme [Lewinellaceae bacterium]|nr:SUMF1/EgtB/PvdO family nonheme iron enzyme [Lewinellaceae bacterium]